MVILSCVQEGPSDRGEEVQVLTPKVVCQGNYTDEYRDKDDGVEALSIEEVSEWVLCQINEVSRLLGVTFEGHEKEAMRLFSAIEDTWRSKLPARGAKHMKKKGKLARELRKLECSVSYGRVTAGRGKDLLKSTVCQ